MGHITKHLAVGALVSALLAAGLPPRAAQAQYFGRNQVQYKNFDFQVLKTEHFDIYFYPKEEQAARAAGVLAERWYTRLSRVFSHELRGRQPIIYYADHPDFEQTNALGATPDETTGGATEVFKRRVVLPFAGPMGETDHVLGHELVHAFQYDMTGQGKPISETSYPQAVQLPLWFIEGMAEYLSVGPNDPHTAMWMRDALVHDRLPNMRQLSDPRYFPYRFGQAFWAYLAGRWGDGIVARILNAAGRGRTAEQALEAVLRVPVDSLIDEWHESIRFAYRSLLEGAGKEDSLRVPVLTRENSGRINTSPALSPDGKKIVYLSEKDRFAIEMFLANTDTGKVIRKLVKTALDTRYESLEFINSAGAWAPDNRRFVFGAIAKGKPVLSIMDTERGRLVREITLPEIGEVINPSWSPDGQSIAFSAISGGLSDLFVYDLARDSLRRITDDVFADLQPAWSPDGRKIAFATDRFSSRPGEYVFGNYRLAVWNRETGAIRALPSFPVAKNINPQWSPDGASLYFVADRAGVSNVYRLDVASGRIDQLTDLVTGVTGITALSPALSAAAHADRIAFSVYEDGRYDVYRIDRSAAIAGQPVPANLVLQPGEQLPLADYAALVRQRNAGVLPPADRQQGQVESYLLDPEMGLTGDSSFATTPYSPRFSLDYLSNPSLAFGIDDWGLYLGAGASAYWSDMLGRHNLATTLQIQGGLKDIGALVGYSNRRSRWNWGVLAGQIPYSTGAIAAGLAQDSTGRPLYIEQRQLIRQYDRQVTGVLSYPFSRVQRVEFSAGFRNMGFSSELRTKVFDTQTGQLLSDSTEKLDACFRDPRTFQQICQDRGLNMVTGSLALVYDNALYGYASPVLGQRYRLEVTPSIGSLNYATAVVDARKYFMPIKPFTLAARLTHYGRYGPDGEDPILADLYLGSAGFVRGYNYNSFTSQECAASGGGADGVSCPVLDQLFGSRVAVAGLELRFPLLRVLGLGDNLLGALPVETFAFGDAGVAWESNHEAFFLGGDRKPVYSAGVGLRVNLFNFLIGEVDFLNAFQRPDKGWHWQFGFTPGF